MLSGARTSWAKWWQQALGTLVGRGWRGQVTLCSRVVKQKSELPKSATVEHLCVYLSENLCIVCIGPALSFSTSVTANYNL